MRRVGRLLAIPVAALFVLGPTGTSASTASTADVQHASHTASVKMKATTVSVVVKASATERQAGGSLRSAYLGSLPQGYTTTAGCRIIGQYHTGYYGGSNLWWDTPVGWLPDADVLGSANVPMCTTRRAVGVREAGNSAPVGQCTWKAKEMFRAVVGASPALYGNAREWLASARTAGYTTVLDAPLDARAIVVFQPGVHGAGGVGHVAWVLSTERRADGRYIRVVEHNYMNQGAVDNYRTLKDVAGMSYILAK